ncbi:MAG: hypothetical protein M3N41_09015 [Acidobacteriota bacterium]|nr:hypothetical protein [Acidobacteriota bacterium]
MKVALLLSIAALSLHAQQSMFAGESGVISHLVDGDGWQCSIQLNNIDATPSQYKLSFFNEDGSAKSLQTNLGTSTFVYGTIPARGSVTISTPGTQVALWQGWALMETIFSIPGGNFAIAPGATVAGTVLFYRPPTASRPTEVSEPLDFSLESQWVLPFDHTNGYATGVALVNGQNFSSLSVFLTFFDENGNQLVLDSLTLARGQHVAFTITQRYPQLVGRRGTMKVQTSAITINVLGFRVNPAGVVSSTSPTSWF